ncbi:hypothetical protein VOLCADRAFT_93645 [Volvox carteri f. nagariensis]|uniref:Uncharacterized protein n=1 Tax=Volvox carteri f. nagariensis TaxID=3068 RepID=D8U2N2_VOLCA|nr:uncharacterized protein VOLCADRAFT_93645 [Volvox carteri f. nagariensis]EFJ45927.1 hypothetical protein VOLCADRAFT_93645 [Volvox carteri f. nagariensis]|eukprot:XP_002953005.1 hypothetical protein VOLCADRAFT_93645 [Volvox carteri f. nagariensis]
MPPDSTGRLTISYMCVLRLDSPRTSDARGDSDCTPAEPPEPRLSDNFSSFCLPAIHGALVQAYLDAQPYPSPSPADDKPVKGKNSPSQPDDGSQSRHLAAFTHSQRLEAVLKAIERTYENPPQDDTATKSNPITPPAPGAIKAGDGWCSTLPDGPYAVAIMLGSSQPTKTASQPKSDDDDGDDKDPTAATCPPPTPPFPPLWLGALSRSLTYLDFSCIPKVSTKLRPRLDPASWDLYVLSALRRLQVISFRHSLVASPLPAALATSLPSLRVIDLHGVEFLLRQDEVAEMLRALLRDGDGSGCDGKRDDSAGGDDGGVRRLVVAAKEAEHQSAEVLSFKCLPPPPPPPTAPVAPGSSSPPSSATESPSEYFKVAAGIRAVRAARERVFLTHLREAWWNVSVLSTEKESTSVTSQPVDFSMVRLLYDLGLLPPLEEPPPPAPTPQQPAQPSAAAAATGKSTTSACTSAGPVAGGAASGGAEGGESGVPGDVEKREPGEHEVKEGGTLDSGAALLIKTRQPSWPRGADVTMDFVQLKLAWPYECNRWDQPTWSHQQPLHSKYRKDVWFYLTSRQWRRVLEEGDDLNGSGGGGAGGGGGGNGEDPFGVEVVDFQALEDREMLLSRTLFCACVI